MKADDQGFEVCLGQVLHLIEDQSEPGPTFPRSSANLSQEIAQILREVARIGNSLQGIDIEFEVPAAKTGESNKRCYRAIYLFIT